MKAYVEEFLYRGRCAECEKGQEAAYHVVLAQWVNGPDGKSQLMRSAPLTPEQASAAGFPLDRILSDLTAAALLERDAAKAEAAKAKEAREAAETAKAEAVVKAAIADRDAAMEHANRSEATAQAASAEAEAAVKAAIATVQSAKVEVERIARAAMDAAKLA